MPNIAINLQNVSRTYTLGKQTVTALKNINLQVQQGEFIALVGPSGSGKSTLLNLLGGLDRADSGEVTVADIPLHTANEKTLTAYRRWQVGFIFQRFNLLPRLTALENVALPLMLGGIPRAERETRAADLLTRVGLAHRLTHRPVELSGGEQQRTSIARALVHQPALILADEPTGNLDSATGAEVLNLLRELNRESGVTLVLVTHDPDVAAYADRIVRLRDGEIVAIEEQRPPAASPPTPRKTNRKGLFGLADMARTALDNLSRRPVRNLLTGTGVLIGIVTLVAMVSFGVGVQSEIRRNFEAIGLENVFVTAQFPDAVTNEFEPFANSTPVQPLTPALADQFAALPEVASVTPVLSVPAGLDLTIAFNGQTAPVRITDSPIEGFFGPPGSSELLAGQDIATSGRADAIVIVDALADKLLADANRTGYDALLGQTVTLTGTLPRGETEDFTATIVGVRAGFSERLIDAGIGLRADIKAWWYNQPDTLETDGYDALVVRARNLDSIPTVVAFAETNDLNAQSIEAILSLASQVFSILNALLGSVGALALLVAALGVANTMMMAIFERTREIGILKALGAAPGEVRLLFVVESALLGLLGGIGGLIIGTLLGKLVEWVAKQYLISEGVTNIGALSIVPPWLAIGALIFATLIGILAGIYPAARAAALDPVAALRYE